MWGSYYKKNWSERVIIRLCFYDLKEKSQAAPYFINDPMTNMPSLPYELVKEYAEQDVKLTLIVQIQ